MPFPARVAICSRLSPRFFSSINSALIAIVGLQAVADRELYLPPVEFLLFRKNDRKRRPGTLPHPLAHTGLPGVAKLKPARLRRFYPDRHRQRR